MKPDRDIIIVGGGVAGLTAAQYGGRANLKTLLIEEMAPGGQALVIDDLENYPGFPEKITGFELTQKFTNQATNFGAEILAATVNSISKNGDLFTVVTSKGSYTTFAVILATGAMHRKLDIPGEKEYSGKGVSYCATCDGPFFRNKKMLVVGGGDAACDEALFLAKLTDKLVMIHRKHRFRAQKSLADRVLSNPMIDVRFNHELKVIEGNGSRVTSVVLYDQEADKEYTEDFDAVFVFIGSIPQTKLVPDAQKDDAGYVITDQEMLSSVPGLYAIGDVRNTPFRQLVVASSDGAIASHSASQYIDSLTGQSYV
ncbi:MAG: thioredoxin-disulfide reductase [Spirochaetia bacterium]|nr:thioredoxin-disulfide reductase [Spirochaetia bacterium]MCF7941033.1 thioredoxin-disulfide reductase [Spirochaetia bacterium]